MKFEGILTPEEAEKEWGIPRVLAQRELRIVR